jgi:hypothetical protein
MARNKFWSSIVGYWFFYSIVFGICYLIGSFVLIPFGLWQGTGVWTWPTPDTLLSLAGYFVFGAFLSGTVFWAVDRLEKRRKRKNSSVD